MIIAFLMFGHDNGAYFLPTAEAAEDLLCPQCGSCIDEHFFPRALRFRGKMDISSTMDGRTIVSEKFRRFCVNTNLHEIEFFSVCKDNKYFWIKPKQMLMFDAVKRKTEFINQCLTCGQYEQVIGVSPGFLAEFSDPIETGIYRTNLAFGVREQKSPAIIVGTETKNAIRKSKLTGAVFQPVYGANATLAAVMQKSK